MMRTLADFCRVGLPWVFVVLVAGCETDSTGPGPTPDPPYGIETSAGSYQIQPWDTRVPEGYEVTIPYTFTNRSTSPVYLVGCRQDFAPQVERWTGTEWVNTWDYLPNLCGGVVEVEPFGTFSQDLVVYGVKPDVPNHHPVFDAQPGLYRLQMVSWYTSVETFPNSELIPLGARLSNTFELTF